MGKFARRGAVAGIAAFATALSMAAPAFASNDGIVGGIINVDGEPDVITSSAPYIYRFADADRVGTAIQAAERTPELWSNTIIIANSEEFADALTATTLADVLDAPVLLNPKGNALSGQVAAYINRRGLPSSTSPGAVERAIVVGGTGVLGPGVTQALSGLGIGDVDRIAGTNRYQTAIELAVATIVEDALLGEDSQYKLDQANIFLASGTDFPDALTAGAAAANKNGVVLLTKGSEGLDSLTYGVVTGGNALQQLNQAFVTWADDSSVITIGGPAKAGAAKGWLADPVETDLDVVGSDRYDTAVKVAEEFFDYGQYPDDYRGQITIASGEKFPDGVVAGAFAANVDGPLLLTREASLSRATGAHLESLRLKVENVFVFGGVGSISKNVSKQLAELDWRY